MKLGITGSRSITECQSLIDTLNELNPDEIVSGGAIGIDKIAERWGHKNNKIVSVFKPDYFTYGKSAPIIRNKIIVGYSDSVLAVWDGVSKGTKFTIDYAKKENKLFKIILI